MAPNIYNREALIELVLWALQQNPIARQFGGLRREAEERVDAFLIDSRKIPKE